MNLNEKLDLLIELAYQRGRRDMQKEVLNILDGSQSRLSGLEPLTDDSVASEGILYERPPHAN